ncbi:hypothetical protein K435DRAFT_795102 [Dendrothele bispora CBS 962.96]|uniref:Alpha-type protein kinase domain-containing protein n=1 Tax=Dendrothele bispora (strain CBS 962.96) TaxID=1314807 RepID=A0A4S8M9X0_DENBC|nr:hypothetical protein K435DRAFT_795102 [Dendrothele bispora CBS 962.96]
MTTSSTEPASCSGPNVTDGCGGYFQYKSDPGLCVKCALIEQHPEQRERYEGMNQCEGCSAIANNLKDSMCGRCKYRSTQAKSQGMPRSGGPATQDPVSSPLHSQHHNMSASFTNQMNLGKQKKAILDEAFKTHPNLSLPNSAQASTSTSTNEMALFRKAKAGYGRSIIIYSQAVAGRKVLSDFLPDSWTFEGDDLLSMNCTGTPWFTGTGWLGSGFLYPDPYPPDPYPQPVATRETRAVHYLSFDPSDEIEFCWPDFLQLSGDSNHDTVAEVYDMHANMPGFNRKFILPPGSSSKFSKKNSQGGQFLQLFLNIKASQVEERYGQALCKELGGSGPSRRSTIKRKAADMEDNSVLSSVSQFNGPPVSTFGTRPREIIPPRFIRKSNSTSTITLCIAEFDESNIAHGEVEILFDVEESKAATAIVSNSVYATGLSKTVFEVHVHFQFISQSHPLKCFWFRQGTLNSSTKVFKRLTDTHSPEDGAWALQQEFKLLRVGRYFWKEFSQFCKERGVDYTDKFAFTDALLAREVISTDAHPSIASGITEYSGTMQQVNKNTLPFLTMNAFAHFIHYWTHGRMVFVDLQGKYMFLPSTCAVADDSVLFSEKGSPTKDGQVLFDPMVHTKNGNSCLGDLGIDTRIPRILFNTLKPPESKNITTSGLEVDDNCT